MLTESRLAELALIVGFRDVRFEGRARSASPLAIEGRKPFNYLDEAAGKDLPRISPSKAAGPATTPCKMFGWTRVAKSPPSIMRRSTRSGDGVPGVATC